MPMTNKGPGPPPPSGLPPPPPQYGAIKKSAAVPTQIGKIPPQAVDLEEVILGAILVDKRAIFEVADIITDRMFYKDNHRVIFRAIMDLFNEGYPIDLLTVSQKLQEKGELSSVGGDYYLITISNKISSAAHIEYHARIVIQKYVQRRLIILSEQTIEEAYKDDSDIFNIIENMELDLLNINENSILDKSADSDDIVANAQLRYERAMRGETVGLPILIESFDKFTSGLQPSELSILAARPGMGKTTLALIIAMNLAIIGGYKGVFFSIEMPKRQLYNKIIANMTGIPYHKIKTMRLSIEEFNRVIALYKWFEDESPLKIVDDKKTIPEFNKYVKDNKPEWVMIDYLQIMSGDKEISKKGGNREQEVGYFSRSLKAIAKKYDIPVVALSQLSRKVDETGSHIPRLTHLRESGSLEQDADNVWFLLRQAYYDAELGKTVPEVEKGNCLFILAKGRDTGTHKFQINIDMVKLVVTDRYLYNGEIVDVFDEISAPPPPKEE